MHTEFAKIMTFMRKCGNIL